MQVAFIDIKKQSPCGHGKVICFSIYGGEDTDFGTGPLEGRCRKSQLWIDTYFQKPNEVRFYTSIWRKKGHDMAFILDGKWHLATTGQLAVAADSPQLLQERTISVCRSQAVLPRVWLFSRSGRKIRHDKALSHLQECSEGEKGKAEQRAEAILQEFRAFFEDPKIGKVWHNYSFDRHVMANMDIHCRGFAADTMHMARLLDSSRKGTQNYSLANLTG